MDKYSIILWRFMEESENEKLISKIELETFFH